MTLRARTLTIITVTLAALIAILYGISRTVVVGGFQEVERELFAGFARIEDSDTQRNVQRVTDALKFRIANLDLKSADWAQWDDTYKFVVDRNRAYAQSNLTDEALAALKINVILMLDASGKVVFGTAFDLGKGTSVAIPESLQRRLGAGSPLLAHRSTESVLSGILLLPESPLMIVSRPILKSDGTGPIRGTLLFARFLDDAEFQQLSQVTHLSIERRRADDRDLPADFREVQSAAGKGDPILVRTRGEETIAGYTVIPDIDQKPALFVRIDIPRAIHKQGVATQRAIRDRGRVILVSLVASILATGLILGIVIVVVLESSVLRRLAGLSRRTGEIGTSGDFSARLRAEGKDEIASLAGSINGMLEALAASHDALEARNAETRLLMDTVPTGLLSLDENFRINPEFSRSAARILGQDELQGRDFAQVLGLGKGGGDEAAQLTEFLDVLRQELVPEESMAALNPFEELRLEDRGDTKWLRLRYFLIHRGDEPNHILAVIEDISEAKRLAENVAKSERENVRLKAIAEDPDLFREFLGETSRILREAHALAARLEPSDESRPLVNEIFRGVHTVKGVAGSFGLSRLAEVASDLESSLEPLRRDGSLSEARIAETRAALETLSQSFSLVVEEAKQVLGDDVGTEGTVYLRVASEDLRRYIEEIQGMAIEDALKNAMVGKIKEEVLRRLKLLRTVPARRGLARSVKIVPGLIERLGKDTEFRFEGQDTPVDCDVARELNTPLVHLLRNALDHGIESSEDREATGKQRQGMVTLGVARQNGHLAVTLADDGQGLDGEKLRKAAIRKGLLTPEEAERLTPEEALELIFRPGFSTAEQVTDVSGRGVGMDAVLDSVRVKLAGDIRVESLIGQGTRFTITVPA
jgi:sensor domain CHASE-containing protein/HPt (histidine-containing phosphotransfer) domain-containing protein/HAMP domain-containing protein